MTSEIKVWQPDPDGTGIGSYSAYVYKVFRPLVGYFVKQTGGRFSIFFAVTPVEPRSSIVWMCISMDYSAEMSDEEVRAFQDTIFDQDVPIVTAQFPEELPLDLAEEISARADRLSIRYRQWLDELGMTYGVTPRDSEIRCTSEGRPSRPATLIRHLSSEATGSRAASGTWSRYALLRRAQQVERDPGEDGSQLETQITSKPLPNRSDERVIRVPPGLRPGRRRSARR